MSSGPELGEPGVALGAQLLLDEALGGCQSQLGKNGLLVVERDPSDVYKPSCPGLTWMPGSPELVVSTDPIFGGSC